MIGDVTSILLGFIGLFIGGEGLIRSSSRLATSLGVPALVVGVTIVAFGTSTPELVVSISAALKGSSDITIGNVLGSNIANIGLILGLAGLVAPIVIHATLIKREIPFMVAISLIVVVMASDGLISQLEGLLLLAGYGVFVFFLYRASPGQESGHEIVEEVSALEGNPAQIRRWREMVFLVLSLCVMIVSAQFIVNGAVSIARNIGISDLVIGLTLVAVGTSLPEIATSLIAAFRHHSDLAAGNVVGSNIANLLVILGLTALVRPIAIKPVLLMFEFPAMLFFAILPLLFILNRVLQRWQAGLLLVAYGVFLLLAVIVG